MVRSFSKFGDRQPRPRWWMGQRAMEIETILMLNSFSNFMFTFYWILFSLCRLMQRWLKTIHLWIGQRWHQIELWFHSKLNGNWFGRLVVGGFWRSNTLVTGDWTVDIYRGWVAGWRKNLQSACCWFKVGRWHRLDVSWKWCGMDCSTVSGNILSVNEKYSINKLSSVIQAQD